MTPERDVLKALGTTVRTVRSRVDRALQHSGLRLGQFQVLRHLWEEDGLTPHEIALRLDVEMPTVTRTVQRMIRDDLVERRAHPNDARSVRIYLSEHGRDLRATLEALLARETDRALQGFSAADRRTLIRMLDALADNMRAD
jgi:DNA-binding MarR family transcriptional regulator